MRSVLPIIVAASVAASVACSDLGEPIPPTQPPPPGDVQFARDVQPIFNSRCALSGCHISPAPKASCDLTAESSYANLVNVPTEVYSPGVRVTPGDVPNSVLYLLVESGLMPAQGAPLSAAQLRTIRVWIEDGAPDN